MEKQEIEYYTPEELAIKLNVAKQTIVKWTQAHKIPGQIKIGGRWRYNKYDLDKALRFKTRLFD